MHPRDRATDANIQECARLYAEACQLGHAPYGTLPRAGIRSAITYIGEKTGWYRQTVTRILKIAIDRGLLGEVESERMKALRGETSNPPLPALAVPPAGMEVVSNSAAFDRKGNLTAQWVSTQQAPGDTFEVPPGHVVKGESAFVDADGRVIAKWIKTREGSSEGLSEALAEYFEAWESKAPQLAAPGEAGEAELLTVYPLPDLHLGMHAWGAETGDDYDLKIATQIALESVRALVAQSRPSKRAVVLGLGDYFHANDAKAATPASGNRLDVDGRWPKVYAAGAELATEIIALVAAKHEEVEVVFLPGNHDPDAAVTLTVALSLFYRATPRIKVWQEPTIAWFLHFGLCLLGATHGHTMKPETMAMLLAVDKAKAWGESKFRQFFFGHIHHESVKEVGGVRVESFGTPATKDGWAAGAGYRSGRRMSALTFHSKRGEIGRHHVNIVPPAEG